ncbi:methyltransferase domain-containing protein [Lysinibacillus sp. NPDC096212]|uniref:class I SAM-dependent methyltransferase n=1 Tax=Lysinibacillus sp. NPDC096212 TaxID=3364135 RepID=UPI00382B0FDD
MSKSDINSNVYWDERFKNDWEELDGHQQTDFFVNILLNSLPVWMNSSLQDVTVCDAGCAEGQGTHIFKKKHQTIDIDGIDFSEVAIDKAKLLYPNINFFKDDIYNLSKSYDIIFTSNVLEHFDNPFEIVKKLLEKTKQHLIIMVPFQEVERLSEHFYTFNYDSFPIGISDFVISYFKEIDCRLIESSLWDGKQAIVIYTKQSFLTENNNISSIVTLNSDLEYTKSVNEMLHEQKKEILQLSDWGYELSKEINGKDRLIEELNVKVEQISTFFQKQQRELGDKDQLILNQNQKINEVSLWGQSLYEQIIEKNQIIEELNNKIEEVSAYIRENIKVD